MGARKYTEEERAFFVEYVPGHTYKEIQEEHIRRFGPGMTVERVKSYMGNNRLTSGTTGRFRKGHVPANKGEKGYYAPGCEKGWFKKGNQPHNHKEVGSERVSVDGYIEIKVAEPNKWKLKHRVVWEEAHGEIPSDSVITFADRNPQNVSLDNLRLIEKSVNSTLNHEGLYRFTGEAKDAAIVLAKLKSVTRKRKVGEKNE